ncbi:hypothetical protein AB0I60_00150 [Actinosynnema sp. NPDC050436]|uniref:hypothetical protein n=1 Tax=Actinosynnema sp. NPDC050436 TaxID=3155659 RepID=UPI0033DD4C40
MLHANEFTDYSCAPGPLTDPPGVSGRQRRDELMRHAGPTRSTAPRCTAGTAAGRPPGDTSGTRRLDHCPPSEPPVRVALQAGTREWVVPWSGDRSGEIRMTSTAGPTTVAAVMHQQLFFV